MNYIKQLAGFFQRAAVDERLNPTHVSMYVSLFQFWNLNRFKNPISISRNELMKVSKISSKATYHKCMKQLNEYGYVQYKPSYNPFKGSMVYLYNFQTSTEQALVRNHTKNGTSTEQALVRTHTKIGTSTELVLGPYINSINNKTKTVVNKDKQAKKKRVSKNELASNFQNAAAENSRPLKKEVAMPRPQLAEVQQFFAEKQYPAIEAEKFFNYFESNGWKVGGRAPMRKWKSAAENWVINAFQLRHAPLQKSKGTSKGNLQPNHLHSNPNKNYDEPL